VPHLTFEASPFKEEYRKAKQPEQPIDFLLAVDGLLKHADLDDWEVFSAALQKEVLQDFSGQDKLADAAIRLWTSAVKCPSSDEEFCTILNRCCRYTEETIEKDRVRAKYVAVIARALNIRLVASRTKRGKNFPFPPNGQCFRGGGLPQEHQPFFVPGKMYRVPNYLATSWDETKCKYFLEMAFDRGLPPILWTVQLDLRGDPKGENLAEYQVHNANYIVRQASSKDGVDEREFLFSAYSVFKVVNVEWQKVPTPLTPHKVYLEAHDSRNCTVRNLELAPWS